MIKLRVLSICLNPALDRELIINNFSLDELHRLTNDTSLMAPGGKATNVAMSLSIFGIPSIVMGFVGGYIGKVFLNELRKFSRLITTNMVHIEEETREDIVILDEEKNTITEINSNGPFVPQDDIDHFLKRFDLSVQEFRLIFME